MTCIKYLSEPRKQQIPDERMYNQKLMKDTVKRLAWGSLCKNLVVNDDMMIDKRAGAVLSLEVDCTCYKKHLVKFHSLYKPQNHILYGRSASYLKWH